VILESNLGMSELEQLLSSVGDRSQVRMVVLVPMVIGCVYGWCACTAAGYQQQHPKHNTTQHNTTPPTPTTPTPHTAQHNTPNTPNTYTQNNTPQITAEEAERRVRALVFDHWQRSGCESYDDTLKLTSLVDFYLPYFPLERRHVAELTRRALAARGLALRAGKGLALRWGEEVVEFLVGKVGLFGGAGWCVRWEGAVGRLRLVCSFAHPLSLASTLIRKPAVHQSIQMIQSLTKTQTHATG